MSPILHLRELGTLLLSLRSLHLRVGERQLSTLQIPPRFLAKKPLVHLGVELNQILHLGYTWLAESLHRSRNLG